jgi:hypothetical protein
MHFESQSDAGLDVLKKKESHMFVSILTSRQIYNRLMDKYNTAQ